jgi:hypothetical protein
MKKVVLWFVFMLAASGCWAEDDPVFGLWEQLVVSEPAVPAHSVRRNFIYSNRKIVRETVFSALSESFDGSICCIKVSNLTPMDLTALLKKYDWDDDSAGHLKSITGWKYIYEANLVDSSLRNKNMHDLVRNLSSLGDASPFSAAVISGEPIPLGPTGKRYRLNGAELEFSSNYDKKRDVMRYIFDFSGDRFSFSEAPFPAE